MASVKNDSIIDDSVYLQIFELPFNLKRIREMLDLDRYSDVDVLTWNTTAAS